MAPIASETPFVPVILGGDIGAYAIGREFHEAYGTRAIAVIREPIGIIAHSRIFDHEPCPDSSPEAVRACLERIHGRMPGKTLVLITNSEPFLPAISAVRDELDYVVTPTPRADIIETLSNKDRFGALCRERGLDTPETERVELAGDAPIPPSSLPFPVVVKPAYSPEYAAFINKGFNKVYFMQGQSELDRLWTDLRAAGFSGSFLVQELIGGDDTYMDSVTLYINSAGETTLFGAANVLLEDHAPAMLGNPVAMITTPMPELWERCATMLSEIGYRGFANFDIKRDPRTGRSCFLEVNPRIGRNSYYNLAAGINPMRHCVEDLVYGRALEPERIEREILYTLVPCGLLPRYLRDPELLERTRRLIRAKLVFDPQRYRPDSAPARLLDIALTELNQYRKFKRYYPKPTETSF